MDQKSSHHRSMYMCYNCYYTIPRSLVNSGIFMTCKLCKEEYCLCCIITCDMCAYSVCPTCSNSCDDNSTSICNKCAIGINTKHIRNKKST